MAQLYIEPGHVLSGLAHADRESLCTLISLYEETYLQKLVLDMFKDAGAWMAEKIKNKVKSTEDEEQADLRKAERQKAFERRLLQKSQKLNKEEVSTESLRLRLWMHLRQGLVLEPALAFYRVDTKEMTEEIAERTRDIFAKQLDDDEVRKVGYFSREYWKEYAKVRLNPFSRQRVNDPTFPDVVKLNTLRIVASAAERGELPGELQAELTQKVKDMVARLDERKQHDLLAQFEADELSETSAMKILMGAQGLLGFGLAKDLAGLAASILLAHSSAVMPLVGGKALVGTTAVLANPLFIVPVVMLGGVWMARNMKKRVQQAFGIAVCTVLVLRAVSEQKLEMEPILKVFRELPDHLPADVLEECRARIARELDEQQAAGEMSGTERFKKAARVFGLWAKGGFVSEKYPASVGYLKYFEQLKEATEEHYMQQAQARAQQESKQRELDEKLQKFDGMLDELVAGDDESQPAPPGPDEIDTLHAASPLGSTAEGAELGEDAFAGEDTAPDDYAAGEDDAESDDDVSADVDSESDSKAPRKEKEEPTEMPTRDLKAPPKEVLTEDSASQDTSDEGLSDDGEVSTVQGKPSLALLQQRGEVGKPVHFSRRETIRGKVPVDGEDDTDPGS